MKDFEKVVEEDYEELNKVFTKIVGDTQDFITENPELKDTVDGFITSVGEATRKLLLRYAKSEYASKLSEEASQEQMLEMKHKIVKMNLASDKLRKAALEFTNKSSGVPSKVTRRLPRTEL